MCYNIAMKRLLVLGLAVCSAGAYASVELMLVLDRNAGVIRRYDPASGSYLGSFGQGNLTGFNLMLDQAAGQVMVGSSDAWSPVYDYNTGNYLFDRYYGYSTNYASMNNNLIASQYISSPQYVIIQSKTNYYHGYCLKAGANFTMAGASALDRIYAVDGVSKQLCFWNSLYSTTPTTYALPSGSEYYFAGEMAIKGNRMAFSSSSGAGGGVVWMTDLSATGVPTMRAYGISTFYANVSHVAFGHNDDVFIAASKADGSKWILRYNFTSGFFRGAFNLGVIDVGGLAMVAAPEPSSIAALGMAALWFLRKRSR